MGVASLSDWITREQLQWVCVTDALPPPNTTEEDESTTSGYLWLWDDKLNYGTMGWYCLESGWWVDSKNFEPTHWAYCVPPTIAKE